MPPVVAALAPAFTAISGTIASISAFTIGGIAVGSIALNLGASLALSAIANNRARRAARRAAESLPELKRELQLPGSRPPKRFAYGRVKITGTPSPIRVVGDVLYMCLILNSRPSAGNATIFFDGNEARIAEGDMLNFAGGGAVLEPVRGDLSFGAGDERPRAWLGRGDQVGPPSQILSELGGDLIASDGWRGLTVLWLRIPAGPNEIRADRWPRTPPEVQVEAGWSRIWDPRDPAQSPDNPATWTFSNNQALCLLDAIMNNPIRRRPLALIDLDSFIDGANLADQMVGRFYQGGSVRRYTANGLLVWRDAEIIDQVTPLAQAGAGQLVQIGGRLAYSSGAARAPVYTITDILEDGGFEFERLRPGSDIPLAIRASYIAPDRDWQEAELPALAVGAGAVATQDEGIADLPLSFVTEPTQAMRVQKIVRNLTTAQKRLRVMLPPDAIDLVAGSVVSWDISELPKCAGNWRVASINPSLWMEGEGVAMRCPVELVEEPANLDAWDPAVDEFELATEVYTPPAPVRVAPPDLQATTGPGVASGETPRIRFSFLPVVGNIIGYEWQWRVSGDEFSEGGTISADIRDGSDRVFGFLVPVVPDVGYDLRVRTIYFGAVSGWSSISITALGPEYDLDPPAGGEAVGGADQIEVSFIAPNNAAFRAIELWGSDTDSSGAAVLLSVIFGAPNTVQTFVEMGLGDETTRYYFARSQGPFGAVSAFSDSVTATTDPAP